MVLHSVTEQMLNHAFPRYAALQLEYGLEGCQGQRPQIPPLVGEGFFDDPLHRRALPWIGDGVEPVSELGVHVVETAERTGEEKVYADIPKRPLGLAFCLGSVGFACLGMESKAAGQID